MFSTRKCFSLNLVKRACQNMSRKRSNLQDHLTPSLKKFRRDLCLIESKIKFGPNPCPFTRKTKISNLRLSPNHLICQNFSKKCNKLSKKTQGKDGKAFIRDKKNSKSSKSNLKILLRLSYKVLSLTSQFKTCNRKSKCINLPKTNLRTTLML